MNQQKQVLYADRQTNRHAHHSTPLPYREKSNWHCPHSMRMTETIGNATVSVRLSVCLSQHRPKQQTLLWLLHGAQQRDVLWANAGSGTLSAYVVAAERRPANVASYGSASNVKSWREILVLVGGFRFVATNKCPRHFCSGPLVIGNTPTKKTIRFKSPQQSDCRTVTALISVVNVAPEFGNGCIFF